MPALSEAQGVNPQVDTSSPEVQAGDTIETGGAGPINWDELEAVTSKPVAKKTEKKDGKEASKGRAEAAQDTDDADEPADEGTDKKKSAKSADSKEKKGKADKAGDEDAEGEEGEQKGAAKKVEGDKGAGKARVYKVSIAGKQTDLPGDTVIEHKGEKVSVQDLLNGWHGKVNYDKKFNELGVERNKLEKSKTDFQSSVKELNENIAQCYKIATEKKDAKALIQYVADLMGADPVEVWRNTKKSILEAAGVEADPDQDLKDENEFYRQRDARNAERKKVTETEQQAERELKTRTDAVMKKYSMSDKDLVAAWDKMIAHPDFKGKTITPEMIGEFHSNTAARSLCEEIAEEFGEDLENPEKAVSLLIETKLKYPEFTKDDLKAVASEALGISTAKASKTLSRKVQAGNPQKGKSQSTGTKRKDEPLFFSDLD